MDTDAADPDLLWDSGVTLVGLLFETAAALERALSDDLRVNADMSLGTFEILLRLARSPREQLAHNELARQLSFTTGGVTRIVDRLEKAALVYRERDPSDKRVYYVTLTDHGRTALHTALPIHTATIRRLLDEGITGADQTALEQALRPMREALTRGVSLGSATTEPSSVA